MLDLEELVQEEEKKAPLVCLLSTGSDPAGQVEALARVSECEYRQISMGQVSAGGCRLWCRARRTMLGR